MKATHWVFGEVKRRFPEWEEYRSFGPPIELRRLNSPAAIISRGMHERIRAMSVADMRAAGVMVELQQTLYDKGQLQKDARDCERLWAALSAGGVRGFPLLNGIEAITVYADHDEAGTTAARTLCQRYSAAGVHAELVMPRKAGADLADLPERAAMEP